MKLIDPEKLKEKRTFLWDEALGTCACVMVEDIEAAPAIDAVPVIRCKDCAHRGNTSFAREGYIYCKMHRSYLQAEGFCSEGVKKSDQN